MRYALLFVAVSALCGCAWVGEERTYYMKRDFNRIFTGSLADEAQESLAFSDVFTTSSQKEQLAEQQICLHKNGQNRVVTQSGVSDQLAYRRCALSPYAMDGGSRMGIRPDGVGSVVR